MPSSPAVRISPGRISPGRELKGENHKRGRSLESGILFREKDDDLALFNEVQNVERENFLLQSNDDFDDMFCKFRCPILTNNEMLCVCVIVLPFLCALADKCRCFPFMFDSDETKTLV